MFGARGLPGHSVAAFIVPADVVWLVVFVSAAEATLEVAGAGAVATAAAAETVDVTDCSARRFCAGESVVMPIRISGCGTRR